MQRELRGNVLDPQLLQIKNALLSKVCQEDEMAMLLFSKVDAGYVPSLRELIDWFEESRKKTEFEIFVPEDNLWQFIWGSFVQFYRKGVIGSFSPNYLGPLLSDPLIADLTRLDLAHSYLVSSDLVGCKENL